ncbi:hypothetical protein ACLF6K_35880 [Streptomyces xanthophaeus]|uniref:hypothetical protein n=1 Tax=Streptomyces xanthophaeus TaxID=67385 RepID=UPI0039902A4D
MDRPPGLSDADWADYRTAARDDGLLQNELADREAQIESGLISSYEEYDFTWESTNDRTWPGGLDDLAAGFEQAVQSIVLLDASGNVPNASLQPLLYQQVRQVQELVRATTRVLDEATRPDPLPTGLGIAALAHLASAAALSAAAVGGLTDALKTEAEPSRSPRHTVEWRLVIAHADARRDLRRAGEAIRSAQAQITPSPPVHGTKRTTAVAQLPTPGPTPRIRR